MEKEILDNNGVLNEDDAVSLLADVGVRDGDIDKLQWSIVYNLTNARASLAERNTPIAQIFDLYSVCCPCRELSSSDTFSSVRSGA